MTGARRALTLLLGAWGLWLAAHPGRWSFLDNIDLPIHEVGHLVFAPLGAWMGLAGGTLLQLLFPVIFLAAFWRRGDRHAATVMLWWLGQNCFNVARYMADARAQELPLVGGGEHDWFLLLEQAGRLADDTALAARVHGLGTLLILTATGLGLLWADRWPRRPETQPGAT